MRLKIIKYIDQKAPVQELDKDLMLLLHKFLMLNIDETIAGKFRSFGEKAINAYIVDVDGFITDKVARMHLEFERIHPFNDGNGRIGRVINNLLFIRAGFPPITIFNKRSIILVLGSTMLLEIL